MSYSHGPAFGTETAGLVASRHSTNFKQRQGNFIAYRPTCVDTKLYLSSHIKTDLSL